MNVVIYTTPTCSYCDQAKEFLRSRAVQFIEHDVSADRSAADEMVGKSGQMGVPVIVIDDQVVIGFDRAKLDHLLRSRGQGRPPPFGLRIADASKIAQRYSVPPVFGAFIGKVASSSPGERAGLREGDIITEMNMRPIRNAEDLERAIAGLTSGSRVAIVFLRGQQSLGSEIVI